MNEFGKEADIEIENLINQKVDPKEAIAQVLVSHCHANNIALYKGNLDENTFKRLC